MSNTSSLAVTPVRPTLRTNLGEITREPAASSLMTASPSPPVSPVRPRLRTNSGETLPSNEAVDAGFDRFRGTPAASSLMTASPSPTVSPVRPRVHTNSGETLSSNETHDSADSRSPQSIVEQSLGHGREPVSAFPLPTGQLEVGSRLCRRSTQAPLMPETPWSMPGPQKSDGGNLQVRTRRWKDLCAAIVRPCMIELCPSA